MENIKDNITKKKKLKRVLCYFGLVFFTILLFVPLVFKIVFKDKEPDKKPDVLSRLVCTKDGEVISSTFQNDVPQNISYTVPGGITSTDEEDPNQNNSNIADNNPLLRKFMNYSNLVYNEQENTSTVSFNVAVASGSPDYEIIFINIETQENYFRSVGFSCSRSTLS